jgi:hypothetical protein
VLAIQGSVKALLSNWSLFLFFKGCWPNDLHKGYDFSATRKDKSNRDFKVDISPVNDYFRGEIIEGGLSPWPREEQRNLKK